MRAAKIAAMMPLSRSADQKSKCNRCIVTAVKYPPIPKKTTWPNEAYPVKPPMMFQPCASADEHEDRRDGAFLTRVELGLQAQCGEERQQSEYPGTEPAHSRVLEQL